MFAHMSMDTDVPPARILVVDDEAHGRLALHDLLEAPDRQVVLASSGEEALKRVQEYDFALALLDVRMAGMDGFETAKRIHACERSARLPIIFLTGAYEDMASVMRGYAAGAVDYVVKPFQPEVLRSKVAVFVDLHSKSAELARQIVERNRAEVALSRANEQLEAKVRERTQSLLAANALLHQEIENRKRVEDELRQAKHAAEAANAAKTEFLANMSHEIRTPMNAVVGMTELALQANTAPDVNEYLTAVKTSSDSLLSIVNDILDLSRIEAGRLAVESAPFSLRQLVGDALRSFSLQASEKKLELACEIAAGVPDALLGDPLRLRQIITNLVGNALKFTDRGEVVLRVEIDSWSDRELTCHFSVSDTGIGIPQDRHGAIFRRFLQAEPSTARRYGGSGLGLTISARLVELMKGSIWVESEPDKGSVFHFTARFSVQAVDCHTGKKELAGLRVLVAEDHALSRRIVADLLREAGAAVEEVDSGSKALRLALGAFRQGEPYHVVLLDEDTPETDVQAVSADLCSERCGAPRVAMLCYGVPASHHVLHLAKPVQATELLELVASSQRTPARAPISVVRASHAARPGGLSILLVEDNALSQKLACYLLRKHGHEVVVADNGVAALEAFDRQRFDVILMDVRMPRMDGLEATARIRRKEQHTGTRVPIIALTANAMVGDREDCLRAGMDECLIKPIQPVALLAAIEHQQRPCTEPASEGKTILDVPSLMERVEGDVELLAAMREVFYRDCDRLMSEARLAMAQGNRPGVATALHTLRGMFRNLSADAACQAVEQLQHCADSEDSARAARCFSVLERQVHVLNGALADIHPWHAPMMVTGHRTAADG
jgi:two-component system sensor histidine kinase/response regulator